MKHWATALPCMALALLGLASAMDPAGRISAFCVRGQVVSLMLSGGASAAAAPRDALFATVMIICNGVVGVCLLVGALRHREPSFQIAGTGPALAAIVALATITLVLPVFTTRSPEGTCTISQLGFVAVTSSALRAVHVFIQTMRHRDYFRPAGEAAVRAARANRLPSSINLALGSGRSRLMQGAVHRVVFAAFLFLAFAP